MLTNECKRRMQAGQAALGLTITMGAPLAGKAVDVDDESA